MRHGAGPRLKRSLMVLAVLSVAYLVVVAFVSNSYYQLILTLVPVWALFGVSWNILSGYGGQLSFGHASFFGIGAYTVTLAVVYWSLSPWLGIPLGMIFGGLAAIAGAAAPTAMTGTAQAAPLAMVRRLGRRTSIPCIWDMARPNFSTSSSPAET